MNPLDEASDEDSLSSLILRYSYETSACTYAPDVCDGPLQAGHHTINTVYTVSDDEINQLNPLFRQFVKVK